MVHKVIGDTNRVAITGLGLVTPLGLTLQSTWSALLAGYSAIRGRSLDQNTYIAVAPLADGDLGVSSRELATSDRTTLLGINAAKQALASVGLSSSSSGPHSDIDPERMAITVGTSFGGIGSLIDEDRRTSSGKARVSPRLIPRCIPSALASQLAINYQVTGPVMTYAGACAASAQAIGEAMLAIMVGRCDRALAGGSDSLFVEPIMWSLLASGAVAQLDPEQDAEGTVQPFGRYRQGMALGEGAAFLVLERESLALARGAHIYAYVIGYSVGNDAHHVTAPDPTGLGAERVMRSALRSAGLKPEDISYVNAHATGTKLGDVAEAEALNRVFAHEPYPHVSSTKGALGHSLGASGAIEAALSVQTLSVQLLPPNTGTLHPDQTAPRGLLLHVEPLSPGATVLSNSFGFGGHNVSLIFSAIDN